MQALLNVSAGIDGLCRTIGKLIGWLMIPLIILIMFDVITRKVGFTTAILSDVTKAYGVSVSTIMQELQWHFHGAILLLSFGFGYLANAHVRVDVFRELLPRRSQAWMELVLLVILGVPFLILMVSYGWTFFQGAWLSNEGSKSMTGLPWRWFIKAFVPIGFFLALLAVFATIFRLLAFLFGDQTDRADAENALEIFAADAAEIERARLAAEEAVRREIEGSDR